MNFTRAIDKSIQINAEVPVEHSYCMFNCSYQEEKSSSKKIKNLQPN